MECAFLLSKENIGLAREEVLALLSKGRHKLFGNLLLAVCSAAEAKKLSKRLAYTHSIHSLLFSATGKNLISKLQEYNWQGIYKKDFSLRINNLADGKIRYSEAELASIIAGRLAKPKVNLANPETAIELFFTGKNVFCCLLLHRIKKDFAGRRAHLRPGFSPTSMNPKLARCLVNLTGIKKGTLLDPFCGTGGILLEAGLMGLNPAGYDIDRASLEKCRANLDFYGIKKCKLANEDALSIKNKFGYVATDLPYGRNSKVSDKIERLYLSFLVLLKRNLSGTAVVVFPDFADYKRIVRKSGLKVKKEFSVYMHKSLTRKIVILKA